MPVDISWEPRGVYRRYWGDVTIAERRASLERIFADPRFDELLYTITDYREAVGYEISPEATAEIVALHVGPVHTNPRLHMAAVVTEPRIVQAIREFIALDTTGTPYRIFDDLDAARAWVARLRRLPSPRKPRL